MKHSILAAAAAIAVNFAVAVPSAIAGPEQRAQEAAQQGPEALRAFVFRTRMIYALNIHDFSAVRDDGYEDAPQPATRDEERLRREKEYAEFREQIWRDAMHE